MADPSIPSGWPCALLSAPPPSVADRQTAPTADELLPQVLALTPRGPAFGTDEAGDGQGASPVLRTFWRALAAWVADLNTRESEVAAQAFPSAITLSLADWEADLGLPDACMPSGRTLQQRVNAVRARYGALGGASPAYYICVAAAMGYSITIEEPTQFLCDVSECCDDDAAALGDEVAGGEMIETYFECSDDGSGSEVGEEGDPIEGYRIDDPYGNMWQHWIVHVDVGPNTYFECSDDGTGSEVGDEGDPIEGYSGAFDLECELRRLAHPHTMLHFYYGGD